MHHLPYLNIKMLFQRIHVCAHSATEKSRLLGDDPQPCTQIMEANACDVKIVNEDLATCRFHKAEKCTDKSSLATARPTHHTYSLTSLEGACNAF